MSTETPAKTRKPRKKPAKATAARKKTPGKTVDVAGEGNPPSPRELARPKTPKPKNLEGMSRTELQLTLESYKEVREAMAAQVSHISAELQKLRDRGEDIDSKHIQASSHLKFLGDGLGVIARELRQIEKHQYNTASQIPPDEADALIVSYILEALPPARRQKVLADLEVGAADKKGLL